MSTTVAVIFGGDSAEYVISEKSAKVVYANLRETEFTPYLVEIKGKTWSVVVNNVKIPLSKDDFSFIKDGESIRFDVVFNAIHGTPGEDGKIQGYFEMLGIPYNNSGILSSALTFNKWACNSLLKQHGIKSAGAVLLTKETQVRAKELTKDMGYPLFVKPNEGGSSFGVSKVKEESELPGALDKAFEHGESVVIEEFIKGVEVTSGVFRLDGELLALPLTEVVPEGEFFDFAAKYEGKSQEITPARISEKSTLKVQETTKKIYNLLNLKGMVRIDYFVIEGEEEPFLIEVNTVPGLSEESIIPQQARNQGISLPELFAGSLRDCIRLSENEKAS